MIKLRSSRLSVAVLAAATVILAAGGAAIGSNMGFKLNKGMVRVGDATGSLTGTNWTSVPYNNPYGTINGFCTQAGLNTTTVAKTQITFDNYDAAHAGFATALCGGTAGTFNGTFALIPGRGFQVKLPNATLPTSIIIVGSHNPTLSLTMGVATTGRVGEFEWAVPYHTTAATMLDLCPQVGLTATGTRRGQITALNPGAVGVPAAFQTVNCGTTTPNFPLRLGEMVRMRDPVAGHTWIPAHF